MYDGKYLESINKKMFKRSTKNIHDAKTGDTVIYRGGYRRVGGDLLTTNSFTLGEEYILSHHCHIEASEGIFLNIDKEVVNGHLSITADDSGHGNGWGAALFELK